MNDTQPCDIRRIPLHGLRLIEASAGTGKSHSLTGLYLRLLVEAQADVRDLLVMTFTRAATHELRERIRSRLAGAAALVAGSRAAVPGDEEDRFTLDVVKAGEIRESRARIVRRLREAAARVDEATISTIHAFAHQAAAENAFDSGLPFDRGEQVDDGPLRREAITDFWRDQAMGGGLREAVAFTQLWPGPGALASELEPALSKPYATLFGPPNDEIARKTDRARALWTRDGDAFKELLRKAADEGALLSNKPLSAAVARHGGIEDVIAALEAGLMGTAGGHAALPPWVTDLVDTTGVRKLVKKGPADSWFKPQDLEITHLLAELQPLGRLAAIRAAGATVRAAVVSRKCDRRQYSYADMVEALHEAVTDPQRGSALTASLYRTWPWALVDEFQDTDPLQYDILRRVYSNREGGALIMIGDPKQAIFGFRGGDVFAYLQAADDADARYGLDVNFRSTPGLVDAVAALFQHQTSASADGPFLVPGIHFQTVRSGRRDDDCVIEYEGRPLSPVTVWALDGNGWSKGDATRRLLDATVAEIHALLDSATGASIQRDGRQGSEPLRPGDIAVLVNTNREAADVQRALSGRGIPAVCLHQASVFTAAEAGELLRLLRAAAMPGDADAIRAALASQLLGYRMGDLIALGDDEPAWQGVVSLFQTAHERWRAHGVLAMLEPMLQDASARVLGFDDGERRMTNYLQLVELLAGAEDECFGMAGLIQWLVDHMDDPAAREAADAEQLRLESDEDLVRIATVHKVKGLQFRVVFAPFAPFLGASTKSKDPPWSFHDADKRARLDFGVGPPDQHADLAVREARAEAVRLLYVAVTRAEQACYFGWGAVNGAQNSALAWLLHAADGAHPGTADDPRSSLPEWLNAANVHRRLQAVAANAPGSIRIAPPPARLPARERTVRAAPPGGGARDDLPARRPEWSVFSFSRLVAGGGHRAPAATGADDEVADELLSGTPPHEVTLRGPAFGTAVHDLLEAIQPGDWPAPGDAMTAEQRGVVAEHLKHAGFALPDDRSGLRQLEAVGAMVSRCVHTPLPGIGSLAAVPPARRRVEMEFYLGLGGVPAGDVIACLAAFGYGTSLVPERRHQTLKGLMHGFIDLTVEADGRFWVIDYKTNDLGPHPDDYGPAALAQAVRDAHYDLQYLIYSVALHRYLKRVLAGYDPPRHLGGVHYLFLRGMNGVDDRAGVHTDRPDTTLVEQLDTLFAGREVDA